MFNKIAELLKTTSGFTLLATLGMSGAAYADPRVLLISIDGFHETDLAVCVATNNCPAIANLLKTSVHYTNA
jgi:hypothetical protein